MTMRDKIQDWLDQTKDDLITNYNRIGLRASGEWEQQLETRIEDSKSSIHAIILGARHTAIMTSGRSRNKNQSPAALRAFVGWAGSTFLRQWVQNKSLSINPYAVAYKIAREGISVPNRFNKGTLITDVINENRVKKLYESLKHVIIKDMKSDVIKILK